MATFISVGAVRPNPDQPRRVFNRKSLAGMSRTIKEKGVLEPVLVYRDGDLYILLDGERRWRAAQMAGLKEIPAEIHRKPAGSKAAGKPNQSRLEQALIANIQREDMNPVEEGDAFLKLASLGRTQLQIAGSLGISQARVNNSIMIAKSDPEIRELVASGRLYRSADLVRALMDIPRRDVRVQMAAELAKNKGGLKASIKAARAAAKACKLHASANERPIKKQGNAAEPTEPVVTYAAVEEDEMPARWDAIKELGQLPKWALIVQAAKGTCRRCSLRDLASPEQCGQCPAVDFLKLLVKEAS